MIFTSAIRDSPAGQILRLIRPDWLPYPEEQEVFPQREQYRNADLIVGEKFEPSPTPSEAAAVADSDEACPTQNSFSANMVAGNPGEAERGHQWSPEIHENGTIVCDWYSTSDPENPMYWSASRKLWVVACICYCSFVVYMSAPIWTSGEQQFMQSFGTTYEYTALGLALFVFGYGVGPLLFGPISEIASIGRNLPYITTFALYMLVTIPAALVRNAPAFMFLRFLQGFFGSPILATGGASLADVYNSTYLPCAMTGWAFACFTAPVVGQIIAGAAVPCLGWRFSIWETLIASAPIIVMFLFLPETSAATILHHRAHRLRKALNTANIRSEAEIEQQHLTLQAIIVDSLIKPMEITLLEPAVLFANVYMCLIYGIYYSFFEAFPSVYGDVYGFDLVQQGLAFLPITIGTLLSFVLYNSYLVFYRIPRVKAGVSTKPEDLLLPGLVSCFFPPIGLFIFGWSSRPDVHWIVSMVGVALFPLGVFVVYQCVFMYLPTLYPKYAASLFAASDFTRCTFALAAVLFSRPMYVYLGMGKACSLLAGLMIGCIFGLLALHRYGARLRQRSKFGKP
ncbi:MFS general substrate transporter [Aureobasidium subglaciale]|nr:MFS general substrate transporter [Aureobasidium subglaciale]